MATLAAVATQPDTIYGDRRVVWRDVTFSNSYTTNGESITPAQVGMLTFASVSPGHPTGATHLGKTAVFDYTNNKLVALVAANTEVTSTTDLSAMTVRIRFEGR